MSKINYTDHQIDLLLTGIYVGSVNPYHLPILLYRETARILLAGIKEGVKAPAAIHNAKRNPNGYDKELIQDLETNIYHFSAAKTFTQVLEFQSLMIENGRNVDLKEFKERALVKWGEYNKTYLLAEYTTTVTSSISALNWKYTQDNKDIFPRLRSVAVLDQHTTDMCRRMHDVTADVDDPIWNHNLSPRHFQCRCYEERIDALDPIRSTGKNRKDSIEELNDKEMSPAFKFNPGKDREIFLTKGAGKHPYFVVSSQYSNLAKHNFNLPIGNDH